MRRVMGRGSGRRCVPCGWRWGWSGCLWRTQGGECVHEGKRILNVLHHLRSPSHDVQTSTCSDIKEQSFGQRRTSKSHAQSAMCSAILRYRLEEHQMREQLRACCAAET